MRGLRAVILCLLAMPGCVQTAAPVAERWF
jgi:hypothetical protein